MIPSYWKAARFLFAASEKCVVVVDEISVISDNIRLKYKTLDVLLHLIRIV